MATSTNSSAEQGPGQLHHPDVWSSVAEGYDDAIAPIMRPYAITTLDLLGLTGDTRRLRMVDVAAGTGMVAMKQHGAGPRF